MSQWPAQTPVQPPPPPPRRVPLFPHAKGLYLWVGLAIVAAVGAGAMTAAFVPYVVDHVLLDQRGVKATGEPIKVSAYQQRQSIFHRIEVRFRDRKGRQHIATLRTQERRLIKRAEAKKPFAVVYDPRDPSRHRFPGDVRLHWSIGLTPVVFALGGLVALVMGLGRLRRRRHLVTHGHAAQGVVTEVERVSASRSKIVVYQFATPRGPVMGQWTTQDPPSVGVGVWVLYDPAAPDRSIVWRGLY